MDTFYVRSYTDNIKVFYDFSHDPITDVILKLNTAFTHDNRLGS